MVIRPKDYYVPYLWKEFLQHLKNIQANSVPEELDEFYNKTVTIDYDNHTVEFPFDAVICNKLVDLIETMIKEY